MRNCLKGQKNTQIKQTKYCPHGRFQASTFLDKLQKVQNSAARLVLRSHKQHHTQSLLCSLHWLPIPLRIKYKTLFQHLHWLFSCPPLSTSDCIHTFQTAPFIFRHTRFQCSFLLKPIFSLSFFYKPSSMKLTALWIKYIVIAIVVILLLLLLLWIISLIVPLLSDLLSWHSCSSLLTIAGSILSSLLICCGSFAFCDYWYCVLNQVVCVCMCVCVCVCACMHACVCVLQISLHLCDICMNFQCMDGI